jgi:hypothetical protein
VPTAVEFVRAPSPALAERVFDQTPKPGTPIPVNRNAALRIYDAYRRTEPEQPPDVANNPPPAGGVDEGFKPGDAARVAAKFAGGEAIAFEGKALGSFVFKGNGSDRLTMFPLNLKQEVEGRPAQLREAWAEEIAGLNQDANVAETVLENKLGEAEGVIKYTQQDKIGRPEFNGSRYGHYATHRGFLINYETTINAVNAGIGGDWPAILENAKKVIAQRFPSSR